MQSKSENKLALVNWFEDLVHFVGGLGLLTKDVVKKTFNGKVYYKLIIEQIYQVGNRSFLLVVITASFTGMVMSLQYGLGLEKFGGKMYVPRLVATTIFREMGPVFTSLILAARVGAGFASEIGSMVVTQQVDAIRALGTDPIKRIVIPRVIACLFALPILVTVADIVGNLGGLFVGVTELKLDANFYFIKGLDSSHLKDYLPGFGKAIFFALFISLPACYFGINVKNGTKEVGIATTKAVVTSSMLILVGDFFLTKFFYLIEKWL